MNSHTDISPAIQLLKLIDETGRHNLVALHPEGGVEGRTFPPGQWDEMSAWIAARNGVSNLYWSVNEPTADAPHDKLRKNHIGAIRALFADIDPRPDAEFTSERERIAKLDQRVRSSNFPPTVSIDSGGGQQLFWKLKQKIRYTDWDRTWAELYGYSISVSLGSDPVQNIDRIMRLPGTYNVPNASKLKRGRSKALASMTYVGPATYLIGDVEQAVKLHHKATTEDKDPLIAAAQIEIEKGVPTDARERFDAACLTQHQMAALWAGDADAVLGSDLSGSGWRASLAVYMARAGFDAADYAEIARQWFTPQVDGDKMTDRVLARDWGNLAAHHTPAAISDRWFDETAATVAVKASGEPAPPEPKLPVLRAGRVSPSDLLNLPPRQWLYGFKVSRKYVTFVASPGGVGKTAWVFALALAAASNRKLLHDQTRKPLKVWIYNLEDDLTELYRRIAAAKQHFDLPDDILDNIRLSSGRIRQFKIVKTDKDGNFVVLPDYAQVIAEMKREQIDILIVDPYLRSHGVSENENEAQDEVMRLYAQIAEETNAGVILVHHTKKGAIAGDMDSLRGGSTQGGGARAAFTLSPMAQEESTRLGIPDDQRRLYVRIDDAKNNMAPAGAAEWMKLTGVPLGNGSEDYPHGDNVQVATAWAPPEAFEGFDDTVSVDALRTLSAGLDGGERYSLRAQDKDRWAGDVLIEQFGRTRGQAIEMLAKWLKDGIVAQEPYRSEAQRKTRNGVVVLAKLPAPLAHDETAAPAVGDEGSVFD